LLLAVEALRVEDRSEPRSSLFRALLARPELKSFLHADEGGVRGVAFSPDRKTLAAGYAVGGGGGVVLWDVKERVRVADKPLAVPEGRVNSVAFSSDGTTLAAGYYDFSGGGGGGVRWGVQGGVRGGGQPRA